MSMKGLSTFINNLNSRLHNKPDITSCKAPFNTLFFSMTGEVYFCLSNRVQIIGKYPQNSIIEITEGLKVRNLRKYFIENNGMPGCEYCKEQISLGNYCAAFTQFSDVESKKGEIAVIEFELSNQCNLQCVMCSENYSSMFQGDCEKTKIPYDNQFVIQITPFLKKLKKASFRGGEPFLIPIYYELWDELLKTNNKVKIFITTNGTVYSPKIERYLQSNQFNISLSIDTLQKESFSKIRVHGNYDNYINNISHYIELSQKGNISLSVCTCIMIQNWQEIPSIFQFCDTNNLAIHLNYVKIPFELSLKNLNSKELNNVHEELTKHLKSVTKNHNVYKSMLTIIREWSKTLNADKTSNKLSTLIDSIEPDTIEISNFQEQKNIFYNKLQKQSEQPERNTRIFSDIEHKIFDKNRMLYLYLLLNHLPLAIILDLLKQKQGNPTSEEIEALIEISKIKFKINV